VHDAQDVAAPEGHRRPDLLGPVGRVRPEALQPGHPPQGQQRQRVLGHVPLAAADLLACVVAGRAAGAGGLDRLAVQAAGPGAGVAAGQLADLGHLGVVHPLTGAIFAPGLSPDSTET
jgi:hypothetical protein